MQLSPPRDAKVAEALDEALGELFLVAVHQVLVVEVMIVDTITEHELGLGQFGCECFRGSVIADYGMRIDA